MYPVEFAVKVLRIEADVVVSTVDVPVEEDGAGEDCPFPFAMLATRL
jgi:hypothetical protein